MRSEGHPLLNANSNATQARLSRLSDTLPVDNAHIADRLESFALMLELVEANSYTVRAYRRGAETIRNTALTVADLVRSGRVRELRNIGPGIESRLRELVETGVIAELEELERELLPDLVGLGRYLGLGAKRSVELARSLDVRTADEFREAVAAGRLRDVPGIGPRTEALLVEALVREGEPRPRQGLLLNRARELVGGIADVLGGEAAGDPRRWRDSCEQLAVVCAAGDPANAVARFAELPQIVALIERGDRRGAAGAVSVLRGIECDILRDGRLDLPDDVLAELEWVQASVHGGQRTPRREMTKRVEEALRNPCVRCLSHPKGRYINRRPENELDLDQVFEVALAHQVALEVNGLPDRLDLSGEHVREALRAGVQIVCSTDAHSPRGLGNMVLSVATTRRGWASPAHVLNTRPLDVLLTPSAR
jgi:histidinol phosphatase-like PHP family hydrolase